MSSGVFVGHWVRVVIEGGRGQSLQARGGLVDGHVRSRVVMVMFGVGRVPLVFS